MARAQSVRGFAVVAALALLPGSVRGEGGGKEVVLRGKEVRLDAPLPSTGKEVNSLHPVGTGIRVGDAVFPVQLDGDELRVSTTPGDGATFSTVKVGRPLTLSWMEAEKARIITIAFRRGEAGGWACFNPSAREFTVQKETLLLVDADMDGFYDGDATDGYAVCGSRMLLPMSKEIVLGGWTLSVGEVSDDGLILKGSVAGAQGTPSQVEALAFLNRARGRNGLPPVVLDPVLSKGCTAHAEYLRANRKGRDPLAFFSMKEQIASLPGHTAEGDSTARKALCSSASSLHTLERIWTTVYDRVEIANPHLRNVGIAAKPADIAVLDLSEVANAPPPPSRVWRSPTLIPADGSVGFSIQMDPGAIPATGGVRGGAERGNPLTLFFLGPAPKSADVKATLVQLKQGKEIPVPVLIARPDPEPCCIQAAVPESILEEKSTYRVTWTWTVEGREGMEIATFTTE